MAKAQNPTTGLKPSMSRSLLIVVGVLVVTAGLVLPQFLPGKTPAAASVPAKESPMGEKPPYAQPDWGDGPDARSLLIRLGIGTAVVLVLCLIVLRYGKRWMGVAQGKPEGTGVMSLIETFPLGHRCFLQLVRIGSKQVLVGRDAGGLKTIVPLTEPFESALNEFEANEMAADNSSASVDRSQDPMPVLHLAVAGK